MTELWLPPEGVHRTSDVITVSAGAFKGGPFRCPAADALKARSYRPRQPATSAREPLEHFTFAPFMAGCDVRSRAPESAGMFEKPRTAPPHDGLQVWTKHALAKYSEAFSDDHADPLIEVPVPWVYRYQPPSGDPRGAREYKLKVWGRCLRSADEKVRELRLPVHRLQTQEPPAGFVAMAALVLAEGTPGPLPARVRIVEFATLDARVRVLFDGTREEALACYREHGPAALATILDSQEYRPGPACARCPFLSVCPALRQAAGLLGVGAARRPRRTWSVTNGRSYRACPARDHMRRLHLPAADAIERDPAAQRGRALHAYLAERHGGVLRPCTAAVPDHWVPDGFDLPENERLLGVRLLRGHAAVCPLRRTRDATDVRTEPRVVRHDTTADVIVIAEPDLLYRDGSSWVWRETKTSASDRPLRGSLLECYPQAALAVLLLARGALGGTPGGCRVELEILRPGGADLETIDPFASATQMAAKQIVRELVAQWHLDDHYAATPGRSCRRCEMARWCPSSLADEAAS